MRPSDPTAVDRRQVLAHLGGESSAIAELEAYCEPAPLTQSEGVAPGALPDEPHVAVWREFAEDSTQEGVISTLTHRLPQLSFPVAEGISESAAYRVATRRGEMPAEAPGGPAFERPEAIRLELTATLVGTLPVLVAPDRKDFETLVRVLSARNEPVDVPPSMGACLIKGFVNWYRVHRYRRGWESEHPEGDWPGELRRWSAEKSRYQDTFLLLGEGPYSGVPAAELDFAEEEWLRCSHRIRLAHEATHYATLRLLGHTRNHAWDELIADFVGIVAGAGEYRTDWALRFLGVDATGGVLPGGRLANYRGRPPLSEPAFRLLALLVLEVVRRLDELARAGWQPSIQDPLLGQLLLALAPLRLEEMAVLDLAAVAERSVVPRRTAD